MVDLLKAKVASTKQEMEAKFKEKENTYIQTIESISRQMHNGSGMQPQKKDIQ